MSTIKGSDSKLFQSLKIGNGKITLKHRVVLAPLTRNRGLPLEQGTPEDPNRIWYPDDLVVEYYRQRTTEGGLLITEGLPPCIRAGAMPGVPGLFHPKQAKGWKKVVDTVHENGGYIYAQLWFAGRASIPQLTGQPTVSASATPYEGDELCSHPPPFTTERVPYSDYPPVALTEQGIQDVIGEYVSAAKLAMEVGFDGVEVHGANGYLPEQFLNSNVNTRTDSYGGSPEKRCKFPLELMSALAAEIGGEKLAIRLSPFGLFNQMRGTQRIETWSHLCREIKENIPDLSYIHFMEPRYEQLVDYQGKDEYLKSCGLENINLDMFRQIMGDTPFFSAGGWDSETSWGVLETGKYDALVYGRWFLANPDFVERLRDGKLMNKYDRSRFYGPFADREVGYTDYPRYDDMATTAVAASEMGTV